MSDLQKHIQEQLQDPEFRKIWEESEEEFKQIKTEIGLKVLKSYVTLVVMFFISTAGMDFSFFPLLKKLEKKTTSCKLIFPVVC